MRLTSANSINVARFLPLLPGDVLRVLPGLHQELRDVPQADAHLALDVAYALAPDPLGLAAGADHLAELVVLIEPVGQVLHADALDLGVDGLLHRDDVHADAGAPGRHQLGRQLQGLLGGQVEQGGHLGIGVAEGLVLHHILAGAHHPLGDPVLDVLVRIVPVLLQNADPGEMVDHLLAVGLLHAVPLGQLPGGIAHPALFEAQQEDHFLLGQQPVQHPEIHVVFLHAAGELAGDGVGDHDRQLFHQPGLFRVGAAVPVYRVVPFVDVDHGVDFFYHSEHLTGWECGLSDR